MKYMAGLLLCGVLLAGCYPIELDTSADGKILIPRTEGFFELDPAEGKAVSVYTPTDAAAPLYALYSPDDTRILAITTTQGGMMGQMQNYYVVERAAGTAKKVFMGNSGLYARWSPDGKYITIAQGAGQPKPPMKDGMPEIHLITVEGGADKLVAVNVAAHHRWMPDSKTLVVFQALLKDEQNNYSGKLSLLNPLEGTSQPLLSVLGSDIFFDLSPDGKTLLLVASAAAVGDEKLVPSNEPQLFQWNFAAKVLTPVKTPVAYALYSPKGDKVLIATGNDRKYLLQVTGTDFANPVTICSDLATAVEGMGNNTSIYASWMGNDHVAYLAEKVVYGTVGKNLNLTAVKADGTDVRNLQAVIDAAAVGQK